MNIEILKATTKEMALEANKFLTKLIRDEKKYDNNINENCIINSYYENVYMKNDKCLLLAKINKKYVGYLYGFIINTGETTLEKQAKLDALYTDEEYRENKIGQELINEFKKWAKSKNIKYIELTVCDKNDKAIKIYNKNDFKQTKIIMQCTL